jgi:lipopolysaccharide export system permease protein
MIGQLGLYNKYNPSFLTIITHILSNSPNWIIQGLPIITLLSFLFLISEFTKNNEIIAIKASGINIWKIIFLFIITSSIIGICDYIARDFIITKTSLYSEKIKNEKIKNEKNIYNQIFILPQNITIISKYIDTNLNKYKNIIIEKYDKNFSIENLFVAEESYFKNNSLILKNAVIRNLKTNQGKYLKIYNTNIHIKPNDLLIKKTYNYNNMKANELIKHIKYLKSLKENNIKPKIALNLRFTSFTIHIITTIISIYIGMNFNIKNNKIINFILSLLFTFIYCGMQSIMKSLGENLLIPYFIASWFTNILFLIIGIYLIIKIKK